MKKTEKEVTAAEAQATPAAEPLQKPAETPVIAEASAITANEPAAAEPAEKVIDSAESITMEEVERLVAEAEQRGYLRGRNETIEAEVMPAPAPTAADDAIVGESCPSFLAHLRPGFWD